MKHIPLIVGLSACLALTACGSSSKSNTTKSKPTTPVTTPAPKPAEVHGIQPADVAKYIENFKTQFAQLDLQVDGKQYALTVFAEDRDEDLPNIVLRYEKGLVFAGFDYKNEKPLTRLSLIEGDLSLFDKPDDNALIQFITTATATYASHKIELTPDGDNFIYSGTVQDPVTKGLTPVRLVLNQSAFGAGNSRLTVKGDKARISGELGSSTYVQINDMLKNQPQVTTLELINVPGSGNDDINMHTARLVRNAGLSTLITKGSQAHSGGVDLFAAGKKRILQPGAVLGVHSWCCKDGKEAGALAKDDPAHGAQLTYFREMLGEKLGPDFYYFTINAAPAATTHTMTKEEMEKYKLVTHFIK